MARAGILTLACSILVATLTLSLPLASAASLSSRQGQVAIQKAAKFKLKFKFKKDTQGWTGGFADLPVDAHRESLVFKYEHLPPHLAGGRRAPFIGGTNGSDDLFMFIKRQVTGLAPVTKYAASFKVQIATNAPSGCVGPGAPGESVYLKVGGSTHEPQPVEQDGWYRMNIDKGNQAFGGENAVVLGHIGNSSNDCHNPQYESKDFNSEETPLEITTDKDGNLWLVVGTDSGFEARTAIYYTRIIVTLREQ